jgi:hypothetical protein
MGQAPSRLFLNEFVLFIMMKYLLIFLFNLISFFSFSQYTGATPWENCFGKNASCNNYGCSEIKVKSSSGSAVMAIVKKYNKVIKHAYISSNSTYTFQLPNGTYQVFFYYGKNWKRNKKMNSDECYNIYGGFSENEYVSKDDPITLNNQIMTYTLTQVTYGNFSPKSSNLSEAL